MQRIHDEQNAKIISKGKTQQGWDQEMTNDVSSASAESDSVLFILIITTATSSAECFLGAVLCFKHCIH